MTVSDCIAARGHANIPCPRKKSKPECFSHICYKISQILISRYVVSWINLPPMLKKI